MKTPTEFEFAGTIKFYNNERGFGFIEKDDGEGEIFFHATKLTDGYLPSDGDKVSGFAETNQKLNKLSLTRFTDYPNQEALIEAKIKSLGVPYEHFNSPLENEIVSENNTPQPAGAKTLRFLDQWY